MNGLKTIYGVKIFCDLDDVAGAAKIATRKTVGLLGDDLAVSNGLKLRGAEDARECKADPMS